MIPGTLICASCVRSFADSKASNTFMSFPAFAKSCAYMLFRSFLRCYCNRVVARLNLRLFALLLTLEPMAWIALQKLKYVDFVQAHQISILSFYFPLFVGLRFIFKICVLDYL